MLLKLRDYADAFAAYQAYLAAGAQGANRREALKIVHTRRAARSTFLEIEIENGPGTIYLDSKTHGALCSAAPSCKKAMLPGTYKVIAERSGYERWTGRVTVENGKITKTSVTFSEKPSLVTVRAPHQRWRRQPVMCGPRGGVVGPAELERNKPLRSAVRRPPSECRREPGCRLRRWGFAKSARC